MRRFAQPVVKSSPDRSWAGPVSKTNHTGRPTLGEDTGTGCAAARKTVHARYRIILGAARAKRPPCSPWRLASFFPSSSRGLLRDRERREAQEQVRQAAQERGEVLRGQIVLPAGSAARHRLALRHAGRDQPRGVREIRRRRHGAAAGASGARLGSTRARAERAPRGNSGHTTKVSRIFISPRNRTNRP